MSKTEISSALKYARMHRGLTQNDAAKATGLTYQAISNFERGANRADAVTLGKLCALYQISVDSVLTCRDWDGEDYYEDYYNARSDDERKYIFERYGPCPRLICEYNDLLSSKNPLDNIEVQSDADRKLLAVFHALNEPGKEELLKYCDYLSSRSEYKKCSQPELVQKQA